MFAYVLHIDTYFPLTSMHVYTIYFCVGLCEYNKCPTLSSACPPPPLFSTSSGELALFTCRGRRSGKCGWSDRSDLSSHYHGYVLWWLFFFPSSTAKWNKYALAPVCISPQDFSHHSLQACANYSQSKKAQGESSAPKPEQGGVGGGGGAAVKRATHLSCDKSISVFNRAETKQARGGCEADGCESRRRRFDSEKQQMNSNSLTHTNKSPCVTHSK